MDTQKFPDQDTLLAFLQLANLMADHARTIALQYFRNSMPNWRKSDSTPVTEADLRIEKRIREIAAEHYPQHGFIGEEDGATNAHSRLRWCVDPIDGTKSFLYGVPTFGTLISLTYDAAPIVGVIEHPALQERWCAVRGGTTTYQGKPCRCSQQTDLNEAVVYATSIDMFNARERRQFDRVTKQARRRQFGVDCYAYSLLSSGFIDIVMEADMKSFDMMALVPVIEGAGGIVSNWRGEPLTLSSGSQILATANEHLHRQCLDIISAKGP